MSYYKCKKVVKKDNLYWCYLASNNVSPLTYFKSDKGLTIYELLYNLYSGNIQLNNNKDNKDILYAFDKSYVKDNNFYDKIHKLNTEMYCNLLGITQEQYNNYEWYREFRNKNKEMVLEKDKIYDSLQDKNYEIVFKEVASEFLKYYNEKDTFVYVRTEYGNYIQKFYKHSLSYGSYKTRLSYKDTYNKLQNYSGNYIYEKVEVIK